MTDFDALYRKYAPDVYRFALYLSGDTSQAEDIVSEVFMRFWTAADSQSIVSVKAYLLTMARNLFLHEVRRRSRSAPLDETVRDPRPTPDALAGGKEAWRAVAAALEQMPEIDRSALLMSAFEGLPYAEIASALGLSLPAVKMKIHRARLALSRLEVAR
jgi:RNA polymerase sigma-70 factor, ECF subfamily